MSDIVRNFFSQANRENLTEDEFLARIKEHFQLTEEDLREVGFDDFGG